MALKQELKIATNYGFLTSSLDPSKSKKSNSSSFYTSFITLMPGHNFKTLINSNLNPKSLFRMVEAPNPNPKFNPKTSLPMGEASNPNLPNPIQKHQTLTLKLPCLWGKP